MRLYPSTVIEVIRALPPHQAILIKGPHGIGKSQIGAGLGLATKRRVIDRRLAQMSEGDMTGLPLLTHHVYDGDGRIIKHGRTEFMPPEWFITACEEPCVLFLDELNRATPEVQQCVFEIVLDRTLQGRRLHPDTIVITAINDTRSSSQYQVSELDPALIDRFLVLEMTPSINDWREWAVKNGLNINLIEFCVENPSHWWMDPSSGGGLEPNKVYPTPRSWHMLDNVLKHANLYADPTSMNLMHIAVGLVGPEAGVAFATFIKDTSRMISAEDIIERYEGNEGLRDRVKRLLTAEQQLQIVERLLDHGKNNAWSEAHVKNIFNFFRDVNNGEICFAFWTKLSSSFDASVSQDDRKRRQRNQMLFHRQAKDMILMISTQGVRS